MTLKYETWYKMKKENEKRKSKKKFKKSYFFYLEKWKKVKKIMRENALFFYQKTRNCKTRKIEKIEFFCAYCVHTQKILWDNSLMLCCSPKKFSWFFETFLVLKILAKKNIFRKKGSTTEISKKKIKKKWKMADFRWSAGIWIQYLGGPFLGIRGSFCKKIKLFDF